MCIFTCETNRCTESMMFFMYIFINWWNMLKERTSRDGKKNISCWMLFFFALPALNDCNRRRSRWQERSLRVQTEFDTWKKTNQLNSTKKSYQGGNGICQRMFKWRNKGQVRIREGNRIKIWLIKTVFAHSFTDRTSTRMSWGKKNRSIKFCRECISLFEFYTPWTVQDRWYKWEVI